MQNLPMWSPRFQFDQELLQLQYKPFPSYPTWQPAWDLLLYTLAIFEAMALNATQAAQNAVLENNTTYELDTMPGRVAGLEGQTAQLSIDLAATDAVANQGVTDAATAYGLAEQASNEAAAAQATANDALAAAGGALSIAEQVVNQIYQFAFFGDELHYTDGSPARVINSTFPYNWVTFTTTAGATALSYFMASPGTWEIHILTVKSTNYAKIDVTIDGTGVLIAEDLYNPTAIYAHEIVITGVVLTNHQHLMTFTAIGKNASSTGYAMIITKVWGRRTGV